MSLQKLARLEVETNVQNRRDGVNVITRQCIGDVTQLPTGGLIIKLNSYINFSALPTDAQGRITAIMIPANDKR